MRQFGKRVKVGGTLAERTYGGVQFSATAAQASAIDNDRVLGSESADTSTTPEGAHEVKESRIRRFLKQLSLAIGLVVLFGVLGISLYQAVGKDWRLFAAFGGACLAVLAGAVLVAMLQQKHDAALAAVQNDAKDRLRDVEKELVEPVTDGAAQDDDIKFNQLWIANQRRIEVYQDIAAAQSRRSFLGGQIAAYCGFIIVLAVVGVAAFSSSTSAAIAAGVIGVSGTALSAYIGATFMRSQSETAAQLREYFHQPVEFSRILCAERLLRKITDDEARNRTVQQAVEALMVEGRPMPRNQS